MPDKHEVGGSTPLEPTSRQCRQPIWKVAERDRSKRTDVAKNGRNSEARERIRKPERKKDAGNRYVYLVKTKTHNGTKRMFIEN